jgi:hypothetical protein
MEEACMLSLHATALADATYAYERVYRVLLPAIMAALQRRKAAGTLLPGACRAAETAFFGELQQHNSVISGLPSFKPALLAEVGSLIGYETYVSAAVTALSWLLMPLLYDDPRTTPLPMLADDQLAAQPHAFVLSALELVLQPRVLSTRCLAGEANFVGRQVPNGCVRCCHHGCNAGRLGAAAA